MIDWVPESGQRRKRTHLDGAGEGGGVDGVGTEEHSQVFGAEQFLVECLRRQVLIFDLKLCPLRISCARRRVCKKGGPFSSPLLPE
jgi:hypothetical protein